MLIFTLKLAQFLSLSKSQTLGTNLTGIALSFLLIFIVIGISLLIAKKSNEYSRKFVHIAVSNWWLLAMVYFDRWYLAAIVPLAFVFINYYSYKKNLFKSVERQEGENSPGTVYYALSLLILSLVSFSDPAYKFVGAYGTLIMGYGDGLAAIIGEIWPIKKINQGKKSLGGSLTMFTVSFFVVLALNLASRQGLNLGLALILASLASIIEYFSPSGYDNLTVPLASSLLYFLLSR